MTSPVQTNAERDDPCSALPEPLRKLVREYGDTAFACGEWTKDDDETYEQLHDEHLAAARALRDHLLQPVRLA